MARFAANLTMMFNEVPFLERFAAARAAGFEEVEFLFPYDHSREEVARRVEDADVRVVLFNLPPGNWAAGERGMAVFPQRRQEFLEGLGNGIAYARALKVPRLHMMAGNASSGDASARSSYLEALTIASDAAAEIGADILIEPLNRLDMPGYFLNDFELARSLLAELGRPNVKLQFDIYHRQIMHGDVTRALAEFLPLVGHIQIASVPRRNEPGTGELNDALLFEHLDRIGYQGSIGCEYRPAGNTLAGLGWRSAMRVGDAQSS